MTRKDAIELIIHKLVNSNEVIAEQSLCEIEGNYPRDFDINIWDWTQGVALFGLLEAKNVLNYDTTDFIKNWYVQFKSHNIVKNINTCAPMLCNVKLFDDYSLQKEWRDFLVYDLPKTKYNGFTHTTSNSNGVGVKLNEGEIWADTLFMAVLYLFEYSRKYDDTVAYNLAIEQFLVHIKLLHDKQNDLFFHGFTFKEKDNFGGVHWLRANGWIVFALIYVLEYIDPNAEYYDYLKNVFIESMTSILKYQNDDKLFNTIIDVDSYTEISGTSLVLAAYLKGSRLGILEIDFKIDEAINEVIKNITKDGKITNVSAGTSIGYDNEHYLKIAIRDMPYGKSLMLNLLLEYEKTFQL